MPALQNILSMLPKLSPSELKQVQAAIARLMPDTDEAGPLYEALNNVLGSKIPFSRFKQSVRYKMWLKSQEAFLAFMDETWPGIDKKIEREVGMKFLLGLLAGDLKRRKVPVTFGIMVYHLVNIPSVFDHQFPGYRTSGLASMLRPRVKK